MLHIVHRISMLLSGVRSLDLRPEHPLDLMEESQGHILESWKGSIITTKWLLRFFANAKKPGSYGLQELEALHRHRKLLHEQNPAAQSKALEH